MTERNDLSTELDLICAAATRAGEIAMAYFGNRPKVTWKIGNSPVTEADHAADEYLRQTLLVARPDYGWLSEESGEHCGEKSARRIFVVDPIDGTRAFIDGKTVWCVSVAIVERNRPIAGVLCCPARAEMYTAAKGQGAYLNGKRLPELKPGDGIRFAGAKSWLGPDVTAFSRPVTFTPHIPSLAYRIAMIANGALDGTFVKPNSHDWDLAAADLILGECGGAVFTVDGEQPYYAKADPSHGILVAGAPHVTSEMLQVVRHASLG